ncbi:MAG: flagellar basal body rod protein FlgB [Nitrospirota bacterium]
MVIDPLVSTLEAVLDIRSEKHKGISENIANMDTPGYRAKKLDFKSMLASRLGDGAQMTKTSPLHQDPPSSASEITASSSEKGGVKGLDGNDVNMEDELVDLAENSLMYDATAQVISARFKMLTTAINGGG